MRAVKIAELFDSIQGEGKLAGVPSAFIRSSGCNLRCTWCDTPYASWQPEGTDQKVEEIADWVTSTGRRHVVFTGGEPVIQPEAQTLCDRLADDGRHITLETAGTVFKPLAIDLLSLSPKLANSTPWQRDGGRFATTHEAKRINVDAMQALIDHTRDRGGELQTKFVVTSEQDLVEIDALLPRLTGWSPADILLMPEGTDAATLDDRTAWVAELCKERNFRFCPRLHVYLYGDARGT
jgi:7-carboxy-7-deazaguanine synthase